MPYRLKAGLGDSFYRCTNDPNPNWGIYRASDHTHVPDMASFQSQGGSLSTLASLPCDLATMSPTGSIQGALLSSSATVTNALNYLAQLPTWALVGGGVAALYLVAKIFGGGHR